MWRGGVEHFCEGCQKVHYSSVWYYRHMLEKPSRDWLCGLKYLMLPEFDMDTWRLLAVGL